jgi:hypothetical protein
MRRKKPILVYCADRELLSASVLALRLHPYEVTAADDSSKAAELMLADRTRLACAVLIHARQDDVVGTLIDRLLKSDLCVPLLLVDRVGDLAPVRNVGMVLYGRNTSMAHILAALRILCKRKRGPRPRGAK